MSSARRPEHAWLLPAVLLGEPLAGKRPPPRSVRDWIVDIAGFLLSFTVGLLLLIAQPQTEQLSEPMWAADVGLGLLACLLLWWRRRWPVQIGVITAVISASSITAVIAALAALFTVAVHRRWGAIATVTVVNLLAGAVITTVRQDPTTSFWFEMLLGGLITAVVIAWGMYVRARRQIMVSLRERAERAEDEQQLRVAQARQLERTRIAREMHDVLAHRISLISLHAGALEFSAGATPHDVAASASVIRESAHEALEDLREILGVLRTEPDVTGPRPDADGPAQPVERPQPTLADLAALVSQSRSAGMHLTVNDQVRDAARVPASVGRTAFRVVQEGLTNARKHAPHAAVTVILGGGPGPGLDVEIRNRSSLLPRGSAAPEQIPGAGQGLIGLIERTAVIGGRLDHGRTPDGDFRLHAWLPWPA